MGTHQGRELGKSQSRWNRNSSRTDGNPAVRSSENLVNTQLACATEGSVSRLQMPRAGKEGIGTTLLKYRKRRQTDSNDPIQERDSISSEQQRSSLQLSLGSAVVLFRCSLASG